MKRLKQKLKSSRGMSLGEMLCAMLILTLVSGTMVSTVSLAVRQFQRSMRVSEAKVLCSTLETFLISELAYTTRIIPEEANSTTVSQYQSQSRTIDGNLSTLMTDAADHKDYGKLILANKNNPDEYMSILGDGAYPNGLLAKIDTFTYDNATYCFTVKFSVGYNGEAYATREFQVFNANKTIMQT